MRSLFQTLLLVPILLAGASLAAFCESSRTPWTGRINGYEADIPDRGKPVRAAFVNNSPQVLADDDPDWRAVATQFNAIQLKIPLDWAQPDQSAQKILDTLRAGSRMFRDHLEIENLGVVLFGFSAGAAGAARTASSPLLSNPDARAPPQRVLAVIDLNELDQAPYMAPPSTPQLFLSDSGDIFGGLLTNVEDSDPKITHEAFAHRLTANGVPLT